MASNINAGDKKEKAKKIRAKKRRRLLMLCTFLSFALLGVLYGASLLTGGLSLDTKQPLPFFGDESEKEVSADPDASWEGFSGLSSGKDIERKDGFYNFLIVGKSEGNSDTILLCSFDTEDGKINILQIPRDTRLNVTRSIKKINYEYAAFGIDGLEEAIEKMLAVPIDRYMTLDTEGFKKFVDAIDGVSIDVPEPGLKYTDPYQDLVIDIPAGKQTLSGEQAEGFVRYRDGYFDKDLGRLKAQRAFISAVVEKLKSPSIILHLPRVTNVMFESVSTNMGFEDLVYLMGQCVSLNPENIKFFLLPGEGVGADYGIYKDETVTIINESFNPYVEDIKESDFDIAGVKKTQNLYSDDIEGADLNDALHTELTPIR